MNPMGILKAGWALIVAYGLSWLLAIGIAYSASGLPAAEHWGTFFALGLLGLLPIGIPFLVFSAVIAIRRAAKATGIGRPAWALLGLTTFVLCCYFTWAAFRILGM